MPEKDEKTEKPTSRRRSKAREEGQVAQSQDLAGVAVLTGGFLSLWLFFGHYAGEVRGFMSHILGNVAQFDVNPEFVGHFAQGLMFKYFWIMAPIWITVLVAGVAINIYQVGFKITPNKLKPSFSKLNPVTGAKKFFSSRMAVDLLKNILKLVVVGWVAYLTYSAEVEKLTDLMYLSVPEIIVYILEVAFTIFWRCLVAMLVIAILDLIYQRYKHEESLKMTKQEVKDEHKQTEGDPKVKAKIRSKQQEMAMKRMMADIPKADVVLTNPTHLAVALAYDMAEMDAPKVVAKGAGVVAERIKEKAKEHNIPIMENKPLAQALYKAVEVGQYIPGDLYEAVATILAHVYRLKNKHRQIMANRRAGAGA